MIFACKKAGSNSTLLAALVVLLTMLMPVVSEAAALGDELILSQLGDPVEVEIAILQWEDIDLDQLQISAGTPQVYESFGLDYLPALENLNFNVIGPTLAGEVKVLVSSREPMNEPYMQLLLVMRWPGGSLLREYVLLFDPPRPSPPPAPASSSVTPPPVPAPLEQAETVPQSVVVPEPEPAPAVPNQTQLTGPGEEPEPVANEELPVAQETEAEQEVALAQPSAVETVNAETEVEEPEETVTVTTSTVAIQQGTTYTVQSGDNLWDIATRHGPVGANANLYQILLSLYELNRDSFINGNISLLKYGVTLQLPSVADVAAINPATAQSLFEQRWNEGSERVDIAERGEPLPPFSSIFDPVVRRPEINPTADIQDNAAAETAPENNAGLAIASSDLPAPTAGGAPSQTVTGAPGAPNAESQNGIPALALAPATNAVGVTAPANTPGATVTSTNPYLDGVNTSAQFMQEMLNAKQQQIEMIEAQMSEMSIRMLEITRVTERLNTSLEEAIAQRDQQQDSYRRDTLLLGGLILVLSVALIAIVAMVLKLAAQIRVQHEFLQGATQGSPRVRSGAIPTARAIEKPAQPMTSPETARVEKLQKALASEQALAVSIIEEDDVEAGSDSDRDAAKPVDADLSREEVNVPLGDMDLEHPETSDVPASR